MAGKASAVLRNLVHKSIHFDGYNVMSFPNSRGHPFFGNNVYKIGDYDVATTLKDENTLLIHFESPCKLGAFIYTEYELSISEFAEKLLEAVEKKSDFITIPIRIDKGSSKYPCYALVECGHTSDACKAMRTGWLTREPCGPAVVQAAFSFSFADMEFAVNSYFGNNSTDCKPKGGLAIKRTNEGGITMATATPAGTQNQKKKGFFDKLGINLDMGVVQNPNIRATFMGVAVKNPSTDNWYIYDRQTRTRTNVTDFRMGNFKIFKLPVAANQLQVGALIDINGVPYFVLGMNQDNTLRVMNAADGLVDTWAPERNMWNLNFYSQYMAIDPQTLMSQSNGYMGPNVLMAMMMMNKDNGDAEFSLDNCNDDDFNGLGGMVKMMCLANGNLGNMLPAMMMMGGKTDDMTTMWMLSQMFAGNGQNFGFGAPQQAPAAQNPAAAQNPFGNFFSGLGNMGNMLGTMFGAPATVATPSMDGAMVACEKCGEFHPVGTNFCTKCGTKLPEPVVADTAHCQNCGAELQTDAHFCHVCGTPVAPPVPETVYCPHCGKELSSDYQFCPACGTARTSRALSTTPATPAKPKPPRSPRKKGETAKGTAKASATEPAKPDEQGASGEGK